MHFIGVTGGGVVPVGAADFAVVRASGLREARMDTALYVRDQLDTALGVGVAESGQAGGAAVVGDPGSLDRYWGEESTGGVTGNAASAG